MGLDYQMAALQAVMAPLLGGDTIHHACGINPFGGGKGRKLPSAPHSDRQTSPSA